MARRTTRTRRSYSSARSGYRSARTRRAPARRSSGSRRSGSNVLRLVIEQPPMSPVARPQSGQLAQPQAPKKAQF